MAIHYSNCGYRSDRMQHYMDINYLIPTRGDRFEDFDFDGSPEDLEYLKEHWEEHVEEIEAELDTWTRNLQEWRGFAPEEPQEGEEEAWEDSEDYA